LEVFRALINTGFRPQRPVEFHWYSGEEAGNLGSQDVAASYEKKGVEVIAMIQVLLLLYGYLMDLNKQYLCDAIDLAELTLTCVCSVLFLQNDMTGYPGSNFEESFVVVTDFVDPELTDLIKVISSWETSWTPVGAGHNEGTVSCLPASLLFC